MAKKIPVDGPKIRKLREARCWTQEDLADACGISLRTIQRIENGAASSPQSIKALAETFAVEVGVLKADNTNDKRQIRPAEDTRKYLEFRLSFWIHLVTYLFVMGLLVAINVTDLANGLWITWPAIGWGIGVLAHGASVFLVGVSADTAKKIQMLES